MIDRKNVLLQGFGFGLKSILLQGLVVIAVELPPPYIWMEGPTDTVSAPAKVERVSGYYKLGASALDALLSKPQVAAAATVGVLGSELMLNERKVSARAGTKVLLFGVSAQALHGKLTASGKHDLSDEELVSMLLELLNAD